MTEQYLFRRINIPGAPRSVVATGAVFITTDDSFVAIDVTAGSQNAVLPLAEIIPGETISIQKTDATVNIVVITLTAPNSLNPPGATLTGQYDSITVQSDGTDWNVIGLVP